MRREKTPAEFYFGDPLAVARKLFEPLQMDIDRIRRATQSGKYQSGPIRDIISRQEKLEKAFSIARRR